ncbi:hypothetical protein ABT001_29070 [Streptomyces sp. NPDC002793]|uniref:hypothetical protein n=1 Tax=Streptomyces sp. NPDC002793 TaxID=3154432 RepID=UPI00332D0D7D
MSTPVDAEQAWNDLQRIRVPQERVYDEIERSASGGPGAAYATAAVMWVFLAGQGLDLSMWGVVSSLVVYVALLVAVAVIWGRRSRMRLHHSRCNRRMSATFVMGAVMTGGTTLLAGRLVDSLEPMTAALIQATVSTAVFLLFAGPARRWMADSARLGGRAGR